MNFEILKMLQESSKLDRSGISLGWCNDTNRKIPVLSMRFTEQELLQIIESCSCMGISVRFNQAMQLMKRIQDKLDSK